MYGGWSGGLVSARPKREKRWLVFVGGGRSRLQIILQVYSVVGRFGGPPVNMYRIWGICFVRVGRLPKTYIYNRVCVCLSAGFGALENRN